MCAVPMCDRLPLLLCRVCVTLCLLRTQQSEADQFYQDCADQMFCFGTEDTCTGTIAGSELEDAEDGGDCVAYFDSHKGWDQAAKCDGSDPTECRAACPAGCTYSVSVTDNAEGVTAGRGFWNRASGCVDASTGCKSISDLYTDGSEMVAELWAYGTEPAFTVVATAEETATNSFSLFGGDSATDTDFTDAPTDQPNPNDDVCLTGDCAQPFATEPTCSHVVDCVTEASACTSACEQASDRTTVVTTPAAYGGAACPDVQLTNCEPGDGDCPTAAEEGAPSQAPPPASGGTTSIVAASTVAAIVVGAALFY